MRVATDAEEFTKRGFRAREFFPHEVAWLPKPYPDTVLKLAVRGVSPDAVRAGRCVQINVYSSWLDGLSEALFTNRAVNWHGQQFGKKGLIAAAGLFLEGRSAFVTLLQSDLCQQIYRSPHLRSAASARLNNRFRYWHIVLFNAILDFARARDLETVFSPTAEHILATTPKPVTPDLFVQIYDSIADRYECRKQTRDRAEYWAVPLARNLQRTVQLCEAPGESADQPGKVICVYHDVEEDVDTPVAASECRQALLRMLEIERAHGVRSTYSVLGRLFREKAELISAHDDHSLAFHSYDHRIDELSQLERVRAVDLQVKGYRPPRSVITEELTDYALSYWNFDWLLSSARSLGFTQPMIENGIVKIPVHLDDYPLHTGELSHPQWLERLFGEIESRDFVAVGLHDCYSRCWLDCYDEILERLKSAGQLWTCDQVVNRVLFRSALG